MASIRTQKSYVLTQDFESPKVMGTNSPRQPIKVGLCKFRKGQIIQGAMQKENGKPAYLLYRGSIVVPITVLKEVVTKDIIQGYSGFDATQANDSKILPKLEPVKSKQARYLDGILIGGIAGLIAGIVAQKKYGMEDPEHKNKMYLALAGSAIGAFLVYRFKRVEPKINVKQ